MTQSFEEQLINSASNGDLEAFNQLVLSYQNIAFRYANSLVDDPALAEDITQESFIKAFQHINSFRGSSFRAWLLTIVKNTSHDKRRWNSRHATVSLYPKDRDGEEVESPAWIVDPNASVEPTVQRSEESRRLYQMLDELPSPYRRVITLIDLYDLDYTEAAQILHIPLGTVKSRLARARMQMKYKLQGNLNRSFSWAV
ncbi:MAG: sigma-70 family RNA polymerase sigma factor [Anaerolineales bacterium]